MHQLGTNVQTNNIGTVHTPFGSLSASVAYRSKNEMTIAPQHTGKENSFMVKSDYFNLDMSPKKSSSGARIIKKYFNLYYFLLNYCFDNILKVFYVVGTQPQVGYIQYVFLLPYAMIKLINCWKWWNYSSVSNCFAQSEHVLFLQMLTRKISMYLNISIL